MGTTTSTAPGYTAPLSLFDRLPFYTLVTVTGFALLVAAGLLMLLMGVLGGDLAESGVFSLMFIVPGLVGMFLPLRFRRWGYILPVLLAAALLAMVLPFVLFSLAHPEAGLEFIMAALFFVGALMGAVGGVVSTIQALRGSAQPGAKPGQRLAYKSILGATVALALVALALTMLARTSLAADVRAGTQPMEIKAFAYSMDPLTVTAGDTVRLAVRNDDTSLHTFTLPEADVDVAIPPGAERLVEFRAPAAGSYTWFCVPHSGDTDTGRQGMVGKLVVAP